VEGEPLTIQNEKCKMKNAGSIADLLSRLEKWLKKKRPHFLKGLAPGATKIQLDGLQTELNLALPADLRDFLSWHDGKKEDCMGRFEEDWLLMSCDQIIAAKGDLDHDAGSTGWNPAWIPFLDNNAGDFLCLDTTEAKAPVRGFWLGNKEHQIVAPSLADWLADFVDNVEKGNYEEDPERGSFMRRS
jgi:cell wall assembly regulator SMI1